MRIKYGAVTCQMRARPPGSSSLSFHTLRRLGILPRRWEALTLIPLFSSLSFSSGFGLMCSPTLHHIFTACGIKDISAKMYGSMNIMVAIKALAHILQGGVRPSFSSSSSSSLAFPFTLSLLSKPSQLINSCLFSSLSPSLSLSLSLSLSSPNLPD